MDSKQCIVAARDGFLERKSKIIMVATFVKSRAVAKSEKHHR